MGFAFAVVFVPIVTMIFTVVSKGIGVVTTDFPAWFTEHIPDVARGREIGPGMAPAIVGTLVITMTASVLAIPLGVLGAVYLHEYGKRSRSPPSHSSPT